MNRLSLFIREYLFNGLNGFILFGLYVTFVSPVLSRFIAFEDKNYFIAFFGFFMLGLEPFALLIKIKNARIRAALKQQVYKKQTGIDVMPNTGSLVVNGFLVRLVLRLAVTKVCIMGLGLQFDKQNTDPLAIIILLSVLFIDICSLGYIYMKTDFFQDPVFNKKQFRLRIKAFRKWNEINVPGYHSVSSYWKEFASDIILQVYAIMLFTALIDFTNSFGLNSISKDIQDGYAASSSAISLLPMVFFLFLFGLMPIRIAYWIEDSLLAFTLRERIALWLTFAIVFLFCFVPGFVTYQLHFGNLSDNEQWFMESPLMNLAVSLSLVAAIMTVRGAVYKKHK
ncbi:MAG: hypothetical protein JKX84_01175 [Flavobacteriales bacterium]|nr:hypothetical protein [Flavobacteriales bacterium]